MRFSNRLKVAVGIFLAGIFLVSLLLINPLALHAQRQNGSAPDVVAVRAPTDAATVVMPAVAPEHSTKPVTPSGASRVAFNYEKCIESCDMQYSACIKRGNTNEYCNGQHEKCLNGCIQDR